MNQKHIRRRIIGQIRGRIVVWDQYFITHWIFSKIYISKNMYELSSKLYLHSTLNMSEIKRAPQPWMINRWS